MNLKAHGNEDPINPMQYKTFNVKVLDTEFWNATTQIIISLSSKFEWNLFLPTLVTFHGFGDPLRLVELLQYLAIKYFGQMEVHGKKEVHDINVMVIQCCRNFQFQNIECI